MSFFLHVLFCLVLYVAQYFHTKNYIPRVSVRIQVLITCEFVSYGEQVKLAVISNATPNSYQAIRDS